MEATLYNWYRNKKVLVTGGAGFIGSHIVDLLVELGAEVTVLDNLITGNLENLSRSYNKITFIKDDITDYKICLETSEKQELLFHCAAQVSVPESVEKPDVCHTTNITGIFNILEAARQNKLERVIFSSSSAVYGPQEKPCTENTHGNPTSPYGFSKCIGELYCKQYAQIYGLKTLCLRYFNVFGPRQNPHSSYSGVVAQLRYKMANNLPITLFGDGRQMRDFIPVTEVARANIQLAALPEEFLDGQALNIASGKSISLLELIDQLRQEFPQYQQELSFAPARPGDIYYSAADCSKLKKFLDLISL